MLVFGDLDALLIDVSQVPSEPDSQYAFIGHHAPRRVDWKEGRYHLALPPPDPEEFLGTFLSLGATGIWGNRTLAIKLVESNLVPETWKTSKGVLFLGTLLASVESEVLLTEKRIDEGYCLYVTLLFWDTPDLNVDLDEPCWAIREISLNTAFSLLDGGGQFDALVLLPNPRVPEDQPSLF